MSKDLTHVKKLQDPNYLGAYELITDWTPDGKAVSKERVFTIVKAVQEVTKTQKADVQLVVYFQESKPMIFNATNMKNAIKAIGSPMAEHWNGKKLTLYVERIHNRMVNEWQDVLRVRAVAPVTELPELTPTHKRWEGALKAMLNGDTTIEAIEASYRLSPENKALLCTKKD